MLGWERGLEQIHRVTVLISLSIMAQDWHFPCTYFLRDAARREQSWTHRLLPGRMELVVATVVVGTRIALPGFEPGGHLQHPVPTPTPAWVLGGSWLPTHDLWGRLPRSAAYAPEGDPAPSTGIQSAFSSAVHLHGPSTPSGRARGSCCFPACFCRDRKWLFWLAAGGPITSHCITHHVPSASSLQLIWPQEPFRPRYISCF